MPTPKLRPIRKAWAKGLASLPLMDGRRRRSDRRIEIEPLPIGRNTQFDLTPDQVSRLAHVLQDEQLARRVVKLQEEKHPYGTMPEMVFLDFLERRQISYKYQAALFGGYRQGGIVLDFLVRGNAIAIQGIYWHNIPGRKVKDMSDKMRTIGTYFDGELIEKFTFVWESRLIDPDRERTMELALVGQELGP